MQYTLRNVPTALDRELRRMARQQGKSLNQLVLDLLVRATGRGVPAERRRSLRDLAGSWVEDPKTDAALEDQRRIDPELWR